MYSYILAIDPSGSFNEGNGTTGWCWYDCINQAVVKAGVLRATDYPKDVQYWAAHKRLFESYAAYNPMLLGDTMVVIEDYFLYANKAEAQINSHMETCQLIGMLKVYCAERGLPVRMQAAVDVKDRWSNDILKHKGVIVKNGRHYKLPANTNTLCGHEIDAIRHAVHTATFYNK